MESPLLQRGEASLRWVEDGANADNAKKYGTALRTGVPIKSDSMV
jgi:hypothetical protein